MAQNKSNSIWTTGGLAAPFKINDEITNLQNDINNFCTYVDALYPAALQQFPDPDPNEPCSSGLTKLTAKNAFIRFMTLSVLDFRNIWPYADLLTYNTPGVVKLNRTIYSDPAGSCAYPFTNNLGNILNPIPVTHGHIRMPAQILPPPTGRLSFLGFTLFGGQIFGISQSWTGCHDFTCASTVGVLPTVFEPLGSLPTQTYVDPKITSDQVVFSSPVCSERVYQSGGSTTFYNGQAWIPPNLPWDCCHVGQNGMGWQEGTCYLNTCELQAFGIKTSGSALPSYPGHVLESFISQQSYRNAIDDLVQNVIKPSGANCDVQSIPNGYGPAGGYFDIVQVGFRLDDSY